MTHYKRTRAQIEAGEGNEYMRDLNLFNQARSKAGYRNLAWELTFNQYRAMLTMPCIYGGKGIADGIKINLDRLDSTQGYIVGNVLPACWGHNVLRAANWNHAEFMEIMSHYPVPCKNHPTKKTGWRNPFA